MKILIALFVIYALVSIVMAIAFTRGNCTDTAGLSDDDMQKLLQKAVLLWPWYVLTGLLRIEIK